MNISPLFYSGTSNIVLPIKRSEYPPGFSGASRLHYYGSLFSSVEINSSFTRIPRASTVEKWSKDVPADFRFTFKLPKAITHAKGLQFAVEEVERFIKTIAHIGDKKGCLLVQLPPSFKVDLQEEMEGLLECLSNCAEGWKIAVEFRHVSWYHTAIYQLLKSYGATLVEHDLPSFAMPPAEVTMEFTYIRFHGPDRGYRGSYDETTLARYAARIVNGIKDGQHVYVYFNNTLGDAAANLQNLNEKVREHLTSNITTHKF